MRRVRLAGVAFTAGAVTEYFYDPDRGRARRARLRDQGQSRLRHATSTADKRMRYASGRLEGAQARARGAGQFQPASDVDLREHLHQVLANLTFPTTDVTVDAVDGVATLRGQLASDDQIGAAIDSLHSVKGVDRVESYLHLPGTPAPNKADALRAT